MTEQFDNKSERILRRMEFVKYLYNQGMAYCSDLNNPSSFSTGLLLIHDSVENCVATVAHVIGAKRKGNKNIYLLDYISSIKEFDKNQHDMPYDTDLEELNTLRINIKHHGILPDIIQHKELPKTMGAFLEFMSKTFLGMDFGFISLIEFIKNEDAKTHIIKATEYFKLKNYEYCLIELTYAENAITDMYPYFWFWGWKSKIKDSNDEVFPDKDWADYYSVQINLLEHKVDIYLYDRFKNLIPQIGIKGNANNIIYRWHDSYGHAANWTELNCKFCLEFCIDLALKFQSKSDPRFNILPRVLCLVQKVDLPPINRTRS